MLLSPFGAAAQERAPELQAGVAPPALRIDGAFDEPAWQTAGAIDTFTQTEPDEGAAATVRTIVRVLASNHGVAIGIVCDDPEPSAIVSFSVRRDAPLDSEDHVRVVLGPFMDGRSGYVFAVNPGGARYDALIEPGGENDNPDWDGIWEAAVRTTPAGWQAEIFVPVQTISFAPAFRQWHFNVQRRLQRRLETSRWAFAALPAGRRPVHRLQPQRAVVARSVATRFESALDQTSVRVADVNMLPPRRSGSEECK